ncbi:response regulator [Sphingomonas sp. IW22]|uniref:response regulator n=1 Tax=Sphingomonas sp. IW22 TaxID=3242489 RepID=UPI003520AE3F
MSDSTPKLNLLIVEDEALIAMTVKDALLSYGHTVVGIADTVTSALDISRSCPVDLALCDVRLANGDSGIDAADGLAQQGIPVVYLSGNCPPDAVSPLVVGCISKPFHTAGLNSAVLVSYQIAKGGERIEVPPALTLYN